MHEFSTVGSAQEKAAHRLVQLPGVPTLALVLDPRKVRAADREAWLDDEVIRAGHRILVANAQAVETGLNNAPFSAAIWLEGLDYDARATRQANGRLHRIGQRRDVLIEVPYYEGTVQKAAVDLVAAAMVRAGSRLLTSARPTMCARSVWAAG